MSKPITSFYINRNDGTMLVITKPTNNCYIKQVETGALYEEAIDVGYFDGKEYHANKYTYIETNEVIEDDKSENN